MTEWKQVKYIKTSDAGPLADHTWQYEMMLPTPLADWDVFDYWEKERVESMSQLLTTDDILFDIGTEHGWCNLIYAKFVGANHMVLMEPSPEFWPNIRATWERNIPDMFPMACFAGFVSDKTTVESLNNVRGQWPNQAYEGELVDKMAYKSMSEESHLKQVPQVKIDDFVENTGITPTALTIDVEGAELMVLKGATKTLKNGSLKVWVSIHDDLAEKFKVKSGDVEKFMKKLGYKGTHLATDHEEHWLFQKGL